jgi:response regulator RpfG family c-di-GMP phosphodiesterase
MMYISSTMKTNVLVADDDMDVQQLMCDVLEISLRNVKVERALSLPVFWSKLPAPPDMPWHLVVLSAEYIKEDPAGFMERFTAANPDAAGRFVIVGTAAEAADMESYAESAGESVKSVPFLIKPFSLEGFEELVKQICGQ